MTANQQVTQTLLFDNDTDFLLYAFTAASSLDASSDANTQGQLPNNFSLLINEQSSARNWSSESLQRSNLCGNFLKFLSPQASRLLIPRKTQFLLTFTNLVAVANTVQFCFVGQKVNSALAAL